VRQAELHQRDGDLVAATCLLEEALEQATRDEGKMPAWICGRLATLYRTLRRNDEEVALLERYCESHVSEEARARFQARLSKARAIADRCRIPDRGALRTIRDVRTRAKVRRRPSSGDDTSVSIAS
jgi:hypothetical protein